MCVGHRGLSESFVVSILSDQLAQPEGTVDASSLTFYRKQVQERQDLGLQRLLRPSWARESAGRMKGEVSSSVSVTLGCLQLSGSCHFARPQSRSSSSAVSVFVCLRLRPSPSSSVSVFVCLRRSARWLVQRAWAVGPMFYIEGLETTVACVFKVCAVLRKVR